jgi:hypothetical protein
MSFKDLEEKNVQQPRVETPEDAELRARAAARHKAKEEKHARSAERSAAKDPRGGGKDRTRE